jgi:NADH:ubiquinone oxidoreductase subunit 5 (subunit L)/multisubunit Na+/H+ antiporter MnhA subunit
LAFFHLLTHALFKALFFICAGGVIHSVGILRIFVL